MSKAGVTLSLADIQAKLGGQLVGDGSVQIEAIAPLAEATAGQISFLSQRKYAPLLATTQATALILPLEAAGHFPRPHVLTENPYLYFARVSQLLNPVTIPDPRIHPTAVISPTAKIGRNAVIHAGVVIGDEVTIGDDALIYPNVTIYHDCHIGDRVVIHAGVVIGADGFGNAKDGDVWIKIPQIGRVIMGDDVEVGANTCIDRGALDDTVIGNGVKIAQLELGHPTAGFFIDQFVRDLVVLQNLNEVLTNARLVVVDITGCINRDFSRCFFTIHHRQISRRLCHLRKGLRCVFWNPGFFINTESALHERTHHTGFIHSVNSFGHDRDAREHTEFVG